MEVVRDDARERHAEPRVLVARVRLRVGGRRHDGVLPRAPVARGLLAHGYVRIVQQLVVGSDEVAVAHALGDAGPETLPCLREVPADTVVQPVDLRPACRADCHQHHLRHPIRMLLRVRERERRAPAVAEHEPPLDTEVLAELLDVTDEVRRRVRCEIGGRLARVRGAATRSALVEQDDPVPARVEEPPVGRCTTAARSAVQDDRRLARCRTAGLPVDDVAVAHIEHPALGGLDRRVEVGHATGYCAARRPVRSNKRAASGAELGTSPLVPAPNPPPSISASPRFA